jgi:hypothetical protein
MSPPVSSLTRDLEEELACVVCHEQLRDPRVLPCLHTFCLACIADIKAQPREASPYLCPTCRCPCELDAEKLPKNFVVANLLDVLRVHASTGASTDATDTADAPLAPACGPCADEDEGGAGSEGEADAAVNVKGENPSLEAAVVRCLTCATYLCEDHQRVHGKARSTRGHEVCSIADFQERCLHDPAALAADAARAAAPRKCAQHTGETLRLFCATCDAAICRDCTIVDHKDHSYDFLEKVYPVQRAKLEAVVSEAAACAETLRGASAAVVEAARAAQTNAVTVRAEAKRLAAGMVASVHQWEKDLVAKVDAVCADKTKGLKLQHEELDAMAASVDDGVGFAHAILASGSSVDVLQQKRLITSRLTSLRAAVAARPLNPCRGPDIALSVLKDAETRWADALAAVDVSGCERWHLPSSSLEQISAGGDFVFAPWSPTASAPLIPPAQAQAQTFFPHVPSGGSIVLGLKLRDSEGRSFPSSGVATKNLYVNFGGKVAEPVLCVPGPDELRITVSVPTDIVGVVSVCIQIGKEWAAETSTPGGANMYVRPVNPGLFDSELRVARTQTLSNVTVLSSYFDRMIGIKDRGVFWVQDEEGTSTSSVLQQFGSGPAFAGVRAVASNIVAVWEQSFGVGLLIGKAHSSGFDTFSLEKTGPFPLEKTPLSSGPFGNPQFVTAPRRPLDVCLTDACEPSVLFKGSGNHFARDCAVGSAEGTDVEFPDTAGWSHVALADAETIVGVTPDRSIAWRQRGTGKLVASWKSVDFNQVYRLGVSSNTVVCVWEDKQGSCKVSLLSHKSPQTLLKTVTLPRQLHQDRNACSVVLTPKGLAVLVPRMGQIQFLE